MKGHGWAVVYSGSPNRGTDRLPRADFVVVPKNALQNGEVRVKGLYTSLTFKDHLVAHGARGLNSGAFRGVGTDYVGTVTDSNSAAFSRGDLVWVVGSELSSGQAGGVTEFLTVDETKIHHVPEGWSAELAALGGTPLLTAALAWQSWERQSEIENLVVAGAGGAVGQFSLLFAGERRVNFVSAVTNRGKDYFKKIGLSVGKLIPTETLARPVSFSLLPERWDAAIDALGGNVLANLLKACRYSAKVAAIGNVLGSQTELDLAPFLLRGVTLQGVNLESAISSQYDSLVRECGSLTQDLVQRVPHAVVPATKVEDILRNQAQGKNRGRVLVGLRS